MIKTTISPFTEAKELLRIHRDLELYTLAINQATGGGDVGVDSIDNYHIFNVALNLLGVPKDNFPQDENGELLVMSDDFYSRDSWHDVFDAMVIVNEDYDGFIDFATGKKELNAVWSTTDELIEIIYGPAGKKKP